MKKSQLRNIIRESIKELMAEERKQYCWWCSGEKVGKGACKRGLSDVPKEQCLSRAKCLKKCAGHKDNDYKTTPKKYLYSTHVKPTKDKKQTNELLEKNIADPCLCKKDSDCKGAKEAGCYGETCFNGKCSHVEKGNYKMKQKLNEAFYCNPGTAGTSCGGGKIWCEVAQDSGYGEGCFCRNPSWCDQNGTNPECGGGKTRAADGSCTGGKGKPGRGNALEPTRRRGMNEAEEAPCYECMYNDISDGDSGRYACQKQQRNANGKCPGGYSSLRKCQRRCNGKEGDRMTGINPTRDR